jgi:TetR/AcrR family transcriptional regulator, transcriptional repressor for nem operon
MITYHLIGRFHKSLVDDRNPGMSSARKPDTAARILDVAEGLVQIHGYNAFSYADIAEELHIRKASLHHHFPTKADLGGALIARYQQRFVEALAGIHRGSTDERTKLKQYAQLYSKVLRKQRMCLCGVLAADFETLPKPMREGVLGFFNANEEWLKQVLEDGRKAKTLRFDGPASSIAAFLVSSLEGAMLLARSFGKTSRFESVVNKLLSDLTHPPAEPRGFQV